MVFKAIFKKITLIFQYFLISLFLLASIQGKGQEAPSFSQGYATFLINLSGSYPKDMGLEIAQYVNPYSLYTPFYFKRVNDSTYATSIYTYGNTLVTFKFDDKIYLSIIQPKVTTTLDVHYSDDDKYALDYSGPYKDVFNNSSSFEKLFASVYGGEFDIETPQGIHTIEELKEKTIQQIQLAKEHISRTEATQDHRYLSEFFIETFYKYKYLEGYTSVLGENEQDSTFYMKIFTRDQFTPERLFSFDFELLTMILQNKLLRPLENETVDYLEYTRKLKGFFGNVFDPEKDSYFYDRMIATVFIDRINRGQYLSNKAKLDLSLFLQDKELSTYILQQNEMKRLEDTDFSSSRKRYLPFPKSKDSILSDILSEHEGKVVFVDLWATWCGPCIENFEKIKWVKDQFSNQEDVVFVYVTDESSERHRWESFTEIIEGVHYYIYENQQTTIAQEFDISFIPSYLLFNSKGELYQKSLGEYMGNEKLTQWIKEALRE